MESWRAAATGVESSFRLQSAGGATPVSAAKPTGPSGLSNVIELRHGDKPAAAGTAPEKPAARSGGAPPGLVRRSRPRRIIAVGGGKGGIGKSMVSANLGIALARHGHRVLLVDGD